MEDLGLADHEEEYHTSSMYDNSTPRRLTLLLIFIRTVFLVEGNDHLVEHDDYLQVYQSRLGQLLSSTANRNITTTSSMAHFCDRRTCNPYITILTVAKRSLGDERGLRNIFYKLRHVSANKGPYAEYYLPS